MFFSSFIAQIVLLLLTPICFFVKQRDDTLLLFLTSHFKTKAWDKILGYFGSGAHVAAAEHDMEELFKAFDTDGGGTITTDELYKQLRAGKDQDMSTFKVKDKYGNVHTVALSPGAVGEIEMPTKKSRGVQHRPSHLGIRFLLSKRERLQKSVELSHVRQPALGETEQNVLHAYPRHGDARESIERRRRDLPLLHFALEFTVAKRTPGLNVKRAVRLERVERAQRVPFR